MSEQPQLGAIRFTPASSSESVTGLIGYVKARYGDLLLDGITVRRTVCGDMCVSWPARRDRTGRDHALVRPLDDQKRRAIEQEILCEIGLAELHEKPSPRRVTRR